MARCWRHIFIAIAGFAAACPLRIQLDLGYGSSLPVINGSALAKEGGVGGRNGNDGRNGHGNGGNSHNGAGNGSGSGDRNTGGEKGGSADGGAGNSNGNGGAGNGNGSGGSANAGGLGGGIGRGNSARGGLGRGDGDPVRGVGGSVSRGNAAGAAGTGVNQDNNAGGNSPKASSSHKTNVGANSSKVPTSRSRAAASTQQTPSRSRATARPPAARIAAPVQAAHPIRTVPVAEDINQRRKPRQSARFIVASGVSQKSLATLTARGFRIEGRTQGRIAPQVVRLRVPDGISVAQARKQVRLVDTQASVDFDQFYYLDEDPPACTGAKCQALSPRDWAALVNWSEVHAHQCGPAPLIGLIDTGVNVEHAALKGQALEVMPLRERHAIASLQDHGTAVAALLIGRLASRTPGLLPQARVIAVDAFYRDGGTADRTDVMTLVAAIETLAARGVRIMNMSLSGPSNAVLQNAIAAAQAKGIVIVAAAGNNGTGAEPSYPAAYPGVLAATAVDQGLNIYRRATRGPYVDLSAPGVNVWVASAQGGGMLKTGTSYAVPFVSAAAGLVLASNPELDAKSVRVRLEESARDLGQPGRDPVFGFGLVQMAGLCTQPADPPAIATVHKLSGVSPVGAQAVEYLDSR
jgi:hypothetical protein